MREMLHLFLNHTQSLQSMKSHQEQTYIDLNCFYLFSVLSYWFFFLKYFSESGQIQCFSEGCHEHTFPSRVIRISPLFNFPEILGKLVPPVMSASHMDAVDTLLIYFLLMACERQ